MAERDTRFGGNIERANRGIPYPTGGRDVRFEGSLPHKFQYLDQGRTVVSDTEPAFTDMGRNRNVPFPQSTGTPNFRPPYGAPGQPSFETWQQQIDPYSNQMRSRTPSDIGYDRMGGGLGGLEEQAAIPNWYKWYDKLINRFGEQKGSELWHQYASDDTGIGNNEYQMAEFGGYGYNPDPNKTYNDYYTGQDIIDMEVLPGGGYDPADDEYKFDRKRGFPGRKFGRGFKGPKYAADGGLMSLRR